MIKKSSLFLFLFFFSTLFSSEQKEERVFNFKEKHVQQLLFQLARELPKPEKLCCLAVPENCSLFIKSKMLLFETGRMIQEIKGKKVLFNENVKKIRVDDGFSSCYDDTFLRKSHVYISLIKRRFNYLEDPLSNLNKFLNEWTQDPKKPGRANVTAFNLYKQIVKERTCFYETKNKVEENLFEHSELVDKKIEELELHNKECKRLVEVYEETIN